MNKINVFVEFQTTSTQGGVEVWMRFLYDYLKKKYFIYEYYQEEQNTFYNNKWLKEKKFVKYEFLENKPNNQQKNQHIIKLINGKETIIRKFIKK